VINPHYIMTLATAKQVYPRIRETAPRPYSQIAPFWGLPKATSPTYNRIMRARPGAVPTRNPDYRLYGTTIMQVAQTANYRIVVEGVLDPMWLECFGGLAITEERQPGRPVVTRLEGRLVDQSALQGVLDTLFMLGLCLITVEYLQSTPRCSSRPA
jgi:hypothetical protein